MFVTNFYNPSHRLEPGMVNKEHFATLIEISPIRSEKVITALREYYVHGKKRKCISDVYGINQGYFSIKIREMQRLNSCICSMIPYYFEKIDYLHHSQT